MTPVSQAIADFDAAYCAMLQAAARVRAAVQAEAGIPADPFERILDLVARYYRLFPERILSRDGQSEVVRARHVSMWLCRQLTTKSLAEIGRAHRRDHGTVLHAMEAMANRSATDSKFAAELLELRRRGQEALQ